MAYKQVKKYGYRDSLEKGDPEKVIYGVDFDAEFEAIEEAFGDIFGGDGSVDPTDPAFEDVVFQNRPEAQKVISELTFEKAGDSPLTMKNTGMYAGTAYIRYTGVTWEVDPSLNITGDLTVEGEAQLTGDLTVDGNLAINGQVEGDLTINGNIIIDGGSVVDPDGNSAGSILDGEAEGQFATWDATASMWKPQVGIFANRGMGTNGDSRDFYVKEGDSSFEVKLASGSQEVVLGTPTGGAGGKAAFGFNKPNSFAFIEVNDGSGSLRVLTLKKDGSSFSGKVGVGMTPLEAGAKLQVSGDISASAAVSSEKMLSRALYRTGCGGFRFATAGGLIPVDGTGADKDDAISIGDSPSQRFKNAYFSGTVSAGNVSMWNSKIARTDSNGSGLYFLSTIIRPTDKDGNETDGVLSLGSNSAKFADAHFSGTVSAGAEFTSGATWENNGSASMRLSGANGLFTKNPATNHLTCYISGTNNTQIAASIAREGGAYFKGAATAGSFVKTGGTASQLLCADGSVVEKDSVGGSGGGMEYDIDQPFTITTPPFYGNQPHSLVVSHGPTTAPQTGTVAVQINSRDGCGIQFNSLDNNGDVSNQVSFGLSTVTVNGGKDPVFLVGGRRLNENNGGNVDVGGAYLNAQYHWLRNMRITGAYSGTNVTFRDSAGVTARDLIDVFVALKDAVSNVNESDPVAAMASMRSAITTTSESLIQKFEAIHEAVADELEVRRIAMMKRPEDEDGTETIQ